MKQYLTVMRPLWHEMLGSLIQSQTNRRKKKKKKASRASTVALFVFLMLVFAMYSVLFALPLSKALYETGTADAFLQFIAIIAPAFLIVFGILQTISMMYHESGVQILLTLPLKPSTITAAKLTQSFIPVAMMTLLAFLPGLITHGIVTARPWPYYLQVLPMMLLVMVGPFAVMTIIIMLLMRFTKFAHNKDRFQLIASIISIVLVLALVIVMNLSTSSEGIPALEAFADGTPKPVLNALKFVPSSWLGAAMLMNADNLNTLWYGLANLALVALLVGLMLWAADRLYLPGVLGMQGGSRKKHALTDQMKHKALRSVSPYRALVRNDFRLLMRTPTFFTQTILPAFLVPFFMIIIFVIGLVTSSAGQAQAAGMLDMMRLLFATGAWRESAWIMVLAVTGFSAITSGSSMISASAVSRQGANFTYAKTIPVPPRTQALAWMTPGVVLATALWLILAVVVAIVFRLPWYLGCLLFAIGWINNYNIQMLGLYADMRSPFLNWSQEIEPVKNSKGAMVQALGMFAYVGALVGIAFLVRWLSHHNSAVISYVVLAVTVALAWFASWAVFRRSEILIHTTDV